MFIDRKIFSNNLKKKEFNFLDPQSQLFPISNSKSKNLGYEEMAKDIKIAKFVLKKIYPKL